MLQQIIALIIIVFLIERTYSQMKKSIIGRNEFFLWLVFWCLAAIAVVFIRQIDQLLSGLGFSSTGINFLLYISIVLLFYFIFRLRLRIEQLEKNLTKLVRKEAIKNAKKEN